MGGQVLYVVASIQETPLLPIYEADGALPRYYVLQALALRCEPVYDLVHGLAPLRHCDELRVRVLGDFDDLGFRFWHLRITLVTRFTGIFRNYPRCGLPKPMHPRCATDRAILGIGPEAATSRKVRSQLVP